MSELIGNCPFCHTPPNTRWHFSGTDVWCVGHPPCAIAGITFEEDDWRKLCRNVAAQPKAVEKAPELLPCPLCGSKPYRQSHQKWCCHNHTCGLSYACLSSEEWMRLCSAPSTIPPKLAEALNGWRRHFDGPPCGTCKDLMAAIDAEPLLNQKEP